VASEGTFDELEWITKARAADLTETASLDWRETKAVTDCALGGPNVSASITSSLPTPVIHVDSGKDEISHLFSEKWAESKTVEINTKGFETVREIIEETAGTDAVSAVETATNRVRGPLDPVSVLLWAGSATNAKVPDIIDTATRLDLCTKDTVYRRLTDLEEAGILTALHAHDGTEGGAGKILYRSVDVSGETLPQAIQTALSK
jgi:hypothetical protein